MAGQKMDTLRRRFSTLFQLHKEDQNPQVDEPLE